MKTLYIECNMGAAGDMLMGALYEICSEKELFLQKMNEAFAPFGITLSAEPSSKCGVAGTHMTVLVHGEEEAASQNGGAAGCSVVPASVSKENNAVTASGSGETAAAQNGGAAGNSVVPASVSGEIRLPKGGITASGAKIDEQNFFYANQQEEKITASETEHMTETSEHSHSPQAGGHSHEHMHTHSQQTKERSHTHNHQTGEHIHRDYPTILKEIQSLPLPEKVKTDAASVYTLLGNAEAKVHQTTLYHIHFHEVGSLDALADVVGCCYLFYLIAPEEVLCSPVHVGNGFVKCAHGVLPVPAPATAELLKGIPSYTGAVASELCTPTGAALLRYFATRFTTMPPLTVTSIGYGMGKKDFEIANCVRVFLGENFSAENHAVSAKENSGDDDYEFSCDDSVLSISCNIDDMTGEAIGLAIEILFAAGALDVYTTPVQMKKNRPGILLTCICPPEERDRFTVLFFLHTTTRGLRYQLYERAKLESTFETRHSSYGNIRVKKSSGYGIEKEKPEFEDLKSIVMKHNCSISLEDVKKHYQ